MIERGEIGESCAPAHRSLRRPFVAPYRPADRSKSAFAAFAFRRKVVVPLGLAAAARISEECGTARRGLEAAAIGVTSRRGFLLQQSKEPKVLEAGGSKV